MAIEIERKFLVATDDWRAEVTGEVVYRQGYLASGAFSVRVRIAGERANLNLKSATLDISRVEFEYEIPLADAHTLLDRASGNVIEKTRFFVKRDKLTWEIDVFAGSNAGLVVAEVELDHVDQEIARPDWLGDEVSDDERYYNVYLARHPYTEW
ncbi:MAG: CYTH domain-containing protein [Gammaproteobacteria bacterium]|nr:CYTH domain-containing protein [Gammaproteobacteria bacterium]